MKQQLHSAFLALGMFCALLPGVAMAGYAEGDAAFEKGDYTTALRELRPLAATGDAFAQVRVGLMYNQGLGVPQDDKEAVKWYRLAADQGDVSGQHNLAVMLHKGQGVPQDYKEAVKWYRLAANQGLSLSQFTLGASFHVGRGVSQDYKEAVKWYRLAANQGNANAQNNLGSMYKGGNGVHSNRVVAYALFNISAASIDPSKANSTEENRTNLLVSMSAKEIEAGQDLTREMVKPGNLLKALDKYVKNQTGK